APGRARLGGGGEGGWFLGPEGAEQHSPGQRPGDKTTRRGRPERAQQPPGRTRLLCPFRAKIFRLPRTQGVALGYVVRPLRGKRPPHARPHSRQGSWV